VVQMVNASFYSILAIKIALIASFCALYALGGQGHKQFRRILNPIVYTIIGCLLLLTVERLTLIIASSFPLMFLAANPVVSYGEKYTKNKTSLKILFRGLCGLFYGLATSLPIYLLHGSIQLIVGNCLLATVASIVLGVLNPFPKSWGNWATITEDVCISLCYVIILTVFL